nr:MAG TPA: SULFITE REDUCTASE ALPHA SUBUNIT [Caudoviricetes sp.]
MDALRHQKHMQWMQNRKDIYYFIRKYTMSHKGTPTTKKISEELDISRSAVQSISGS